jgi:putative CocE/NonD family hydrolase
VAVIAGFNACVILGAAAMIWEATAADASGVDIHFFQKIRLRDGIELNGTIYTPKDQRQPAPCLMLLTPYIANGEHARAVYFASSGYPAALVDSRGRGDSGGEFRPFLREGKDGYDAVEWLAGQSYCNGRVGMWGASYNGYVQWAVAKERPPHLAAIMPTAAAYIGLDFPMRNNIKYPFAVQWLILTHGRTAPWNSFADESYWAEHLRSWYESGEPYAELDRMLGLPSATFQEWIRHPELGAYWDAYNPSSEDYMRMSIPILTITGSYDDDQTGALEHYQQYMLSVSRTARARHYLVIGPWDHGGTETPHAAFGGLRFGPASVLNMQELEMDWFRWTLDDGPTPAFLRKAVAFYVAGAERWRYADTLEEATGRMAAYFLASHAGASSPFSSGELQQSPGSGTPDEYRYDPRDVSGPEITSEQRMDSASLTDQTMLLALSGRELVYHTAPFDTDTEITGFFRLSAWISIDRPDTDFYVSVYQITPEGGAIRLSTDAMRARHRESLRAQKLISSEAPLLYDFKHFTFVSRQVTKGSRLRLVIAPLGHLVEAIFPERNYNGGGVVAEESARDGKPVIVRLYHDREHESTLYVPIGRERATDAEALPLPAT